MRIKRLDITGFKSFCDHTRILFDSTLTAVVGPNGCGKSNIVDAIRWGLGEQSPKNLRGRGMEDVIFNGSESRGPQSMAEVTITFDNNDGLSHPNYTDYPEVAVTRRLHRDGTSEYLVNKTPCRLMDITELFLGTGGGARAYSIIEQGRIGLIVSSRSEDRRSMIEEAAGITRFKKARAVASKKMEQTRQNMLRINDVVAEMERNLANLKRQARKAERYRSHAQAQRDLALHPASPRYLELRAQAMVVEAALGEALERAESARVAVETREADVEKLRLDEAEARNALEILKSRAFELDKAVQMVESEVSHLLDTMRRIDLDGQALAEQESEAAGRLAALEEERRVIRERLGALENDAMVTAARRQEAERRAEEAREKLAVLGREFDVKRDQMSRARARVAAAASALENHERRLEESLARLEVVRNDRRALEDRVAALGARAAEMETLSTRAQGALETAESAARTEGAAFEGLRVRLDECDLERQAVRDELQGKISRLGSLEEMNSGLERHDRAVKEAVEALREAGETSCLGLLIDFIECPAEYEVALAAALADRLQALVIRDHEQGLALLGWMKDRDLGRITALPVLGTVERERERAAIGDPAVLGRLIEFLKVDPSIEGLASNLLGGVHIVRSGDDARRLWADNEGRATFVTADGQLLDASGVLRGGRADSPGSDLLGQKRQIRELAGVVDDLEGRHLTLEKRFNDLKDELLRRRDAAEKARQEAQAQEFTLAGARKDRARAQEDLEGARERLDATDREVTQQQEQVRRIREDQAVVAAGLEEAKAEIAQLERTIAHQAAEIDANRSEADRLAAAASDARVLEAQFEQQHRSARERLAQIDESICEISSRQDRFAEKKAAGAAEAGKAAGRVVRCREELSARLDQAEEVRGLVEQAARALDAASSALIEGDAGLKRHRGEADGLRAVVSDLRMDARQAELDVVHLLETIADRHDLNLLRILGDYHMREIPGEEVRLRIEELKRLIERMGPINPAAIEEYADTLARYERKVEQKADVEQALEDLEAAISRMDKDSRRLFKETFASVNEKFQRIFPRLFQGGQARLELTDPSDILSSGVDIVAQPPGKKLGNIELMSGGEKALTAVSMLFAIFLHRPSPFCLLDEVDAPLDETNVGRFVEMVREMTDRSQFIVITHSKVTMEGSDALYGVTMQEPGVSKMVSVRLVHSVKAAANA